MKNDLKLSVVAVLSALAAGAAGTALAGPASAADPTALGTYTFEAEDGESSTWTLAPCAEDTDNCVRVSEAGNSQRAPWSANAYSSVGSWILFVEQPDAILCGDGSSVPGRNNYSWDAVGLSGNASIFTAGACGTDAESLAIPFVLTKTGGGPVQFPTAPVYMEPYVVDIPEPYVPPAPQGPLPAESDPALVATPAIIPNASEPLTEAEVAEPGFNAIPGGAGESGRR